MRGSGIKGGESNRERGSGDVSLKKKKEKVWLYQNVCHVWFAKWN